MTWKNWTFSFILLCICTYAYAQEQIVSFTDDALPVLNDELRDKVNASKDQTINGEKTFGEIPLLPASNPSSDNQAARKAYVDTKITTPSSPAQGDILYYNGSAWASLVASTAGYSLITNGAAANPSFVSRAKITVITHTGTGSAHSFDHNHGATPKFIYTFPVDTNGHTPVAWNDNMTATYSLNVVGQTMLNSQITAVSSTQITVGTSTNCNQSGHNYGFLCISWP